MNVERLWRSVGTRRLAAILAACVLLVELWFYAAELFEHYPVEHWLLWDLLKLWGYVASFMLACSSGGLSVVEGLLRVRGMTRLERSVSALAVGVVLFTFCLYLGGALGWFNALFASALPLALSALGLRRLLALLAQLKSEARARCSASWLSRLVAGFGVLCVGLVYLGSMTPDSLNYDAGWYHVTVAQDYAREGRLVPFFADYNRAMPQLASLLYTWCYLVPGLSVPLKWMLVLHLEFGLFLWTLAGVSAVVRWVVDDPGLRHAWVCMFLFPMLFVYDSNLGGAADHVLALFAPPLLIAMRHLWPTLAPANCLLFGVLAGGAALTKYQAVYLLVPFLPPLAWRWSRLLYERHAKGMELARLVWLWLAPLAVLGVTLLVWSPHLLKNAIFYGNPVYPLLLDVFSTSTPAGEDAAFHFDQVFKDRRWVPEGSVWQRSIHAVRLFFTFSFEPHYTFGHSLPLFGSLFTLLLLLTPLVWSRRLALVGVVAAGAVLLWGYTFNVDRNLQTFLPLLVVATAALIVLLWRMGRLVRAALVPLLGLQVSWAVAAAVWGSSARVNSSLELLRSGFDGRAEQRYADYRSTYRAMDRVLPEQARVLLHMHHQSLGIDRPTLVDWTGHQGLIQYRHVLSAADLLRYYRSLGVTHVLYVPKERPASSLQEELVFNVLMRRLRKDQLSFSPYVVVPVPEVPPAEESAYRALLLGMPGYRDGLYSIARLNVIEYLPQEAKQYPAPDQAATDSSGELELLARADALFMGSARKPNGALQTSLAAMHLVIAYPGQFSLYLKPLTATGAAR